MSELLAQNWWLLVLAVLPSLAAWAVLPMGSTVKAGLILAALILLSPVVDFVFHTQRLTPRWWMRLRIPLSLALAALTALSVWWGR